MPGQEITPRGTKGFALRPKPVTVPDFAAAEARERAEAARTDLHDRIRERLEPFEPIFAQLVQSDYEDTRAEEIGDYGYKGRTASVRGQLLHWATIGRERKKTGGTITSQRTIDGKDGIEHPITLSYHLDKKGTPVIDEYTQSWPLRNGASSSLRIKFTEGKIGMVEFGLYYRDYYSRFSREEGENKKTLYDQTVAPYWGPLDSETEIDKTSDFPHNLVFDTDNMYGGHVIAAVIFDDRVNTDAQTIKSHYNRMNANAPKYRGPQVFIQNQRPKHYYSSVGHYGFDGRVGDTGEFVALSSTAGGSYYKEDDFGKSKSVEEYLNVTDHMLALIAT